MKQPIIRTWTLWLYILSQYRALAITVSFFQPLMPDLDPTKADQLARLEAAVAASAAENSSLLVVPELFLTGYNLLAGSRAEPRGGPSYEAAQSIAVQYNVSILWTYPELGDDGRVYDAAALLHRSGRSLADYRKVNLASGEDTVFTAGGAFAPVVEIEEGVRVGMLICFDVFLPEPARILALDHANLILVPTANGYPADYNPLARTIVPARALENNAFVAYVNWVQPRRDPLVAFHGQSSVADPSATLLVNGPADAEALWHVALNLTGVSGSTAIGRPSPDYESGLCTNVTA